MANGPRKPAHDPYRFFKGPGIFVTLAIIVPLMLIKLNRPWWQTFLIAIVGFGAGHAVDYLWDRRKGRRSP
jgi:hypothetical protein